MNQELPVPNWDNFTPEQKRLFQAWIKSLEDTQAISMELIKSLNGKEITFEATNTSNFIAPAKELPCDLAQTAKLTACIARCVFDSNRQQCSDNCRQQYKNACTAEIMKELII